MASKHDDQEVEADPPLSVDSTTLVKDSAVQRQQAQELVNTQQPESQSASSTAAGNEEKSNNAESSNSKKIPSQAPSTTSSAKNLAAASSKKTTMSHQNYNLLRFPLRVGITWKKGEKLEAMDFSRTWYPSKIVEIDEEEKYVLIHFEGWNSRYDEWVAMDSEKLRPQTRHSERKDKGNKKRRNHPHPIYRAGEQVLARWTDCKKYPAKVNRLMDNGSYEVVFYDGVTRFIQPINIQPMPPEMLLAMQEASNPIPNPTAAKPSFKDVPLKLPDNVLQRTKSTEEQIKSSSGKDPVFEKAKLSFHRRRHTLGESSLKRSALKKKKRLKTLPGLVKRENLTPLPSESHNASEPGISQTNPSLSSSIEEGIVDAGSIISPNTASGANDITTGSSVAVTNIVSLNKNGLSPLGAKRVKKRANTDSSLSSKKKRQKLRKAFESKSPSHQQSVRAKSFDFGTPSPAVTLLPLKPEIFIPSKAFVVEEDHNHFKCPHDGCSKAFRKENLLTYHIKYYHTDPESQSAASSNLTSSAHAQTASPSAPQASSSTTGHGSPLLLPSPAAVHGNVAGTPMSRKRRKKTDSVCSTDSDLSISSRGKASNKRQRHDSEISVTGSPDLIPKDSWMDLKLRAAQDSPLEDNVEPEPTEMEADLVNCVCGIRETSGLMIQCDVCMCWQHFICVDPKGTGVPPTNYVCLACEKPKGLRDSCRYMYDMSFERHGELPSFSFSTGQNRQTDAKLNHLKAVAKKCNALTSILLGIKSALHSTKRQIKISKEEDDKEFQLWQTDWDNWTKPEEDLTLTPHSVDPVPSPTPSTFLFPPTPTPPASANLSALSPSTSSTNLDGNLMSPVMNNDTNILDDEPADTGPFSPESINPSSTSGPTSQASLNVASSPHHTSSSLLALSADATVAALSPQSAVKPDSLLSINLKPSDADSMNIEHNQSCSVTPPSSRLQPSKIPPTPLSESRHISSSSKEGVSNLVCDLFPGSAGDAASVLNKEKVQTRESQSDSQESSLTQQRHDDSKKSIEAALLKDSVSNTQVATTLPVNIPSSSQTLTIDCQSSKTSSGLRFDTISSLPFPAKNNSPPSLTTVASSSITTSSSLSTIVSLSPLKNSESKQVSILSSNTMSRSNIGKEENKQDMKDLFSLKRTLTSEKVEEPSTNREKEDALPSTNHISELYIDVNEKQNATDDCEEDNDTDTAEESVDPYRNCEHNLLVHISNVHSNMEEQFMELEHTISELETSDLSDPTIQLCDDNVLNDIPALRKSLRRLLYNLSKLQHLPSLL